MAQVEELWAMLDAARAERDTARRIIASMGDDYYNDHHKRHHEEEDKLRAELAEAKAKTHALIPAAPGEPKKETT